MPRESAITIRHSTGQQAIVDSINKLKDATNNTASYLFRDNETPSGIVDGANKVFTLADNPNPNLSLRVYLNGVYQSPIGEDYVLSGITITFINAPLTGSIIRAYYRYK